MRGHHGTQSSRFGSHEPTFYFDGAKCYYGIDSLTLQDEELLPRIVMTDGSIPYEPIKRCHTIRHLQHNPTKQ